MRSTPRLAALLLVWTATLLAAPAAAQPAPNAPDSAPPAKAPDSAPPAKADSAPPAKADSAPPARAPSPAPATATLPPPAITAGPTAHLVLPSWMPSIEIEPKLDVIAGYALRVTPAESGASEWFHSFYLERALPSLLVRVGPAEAKVAVESVYSTSEGALAGVAGDSLLLRVREARVGYRPTSWLAFDVGVVPTFVIPTFDAGLGLRALGPVFVEEAGYASPADLGITGKVSFPKGYGFAALGAFNGEGYTNRELNRGKNIEVAALLHPAPGGRLAPLSLFAAYVNGSSGTGISRADRVTAALLWQGERLRGGVTFTYALGVRDDGAREAYVIDAQLRAEPVPRLLLAARAAVFDRDATGDQDLTASLTGAVGFRVAPPLEAFLSLQRAAPEPAVASSTPGADFWEGRLLARFEF